MDISPRSSERRTKSSATHDFYHAGGHRVDLHRSRHLVAYPWVEERARPRVLAADLSTPPLFLRERGLVIISADDGPIEDGRDGAVPVFDIPGGSMLVPRPEVYADFAGRTDREIQLVLREVGAQLVSEAGPAVPFHRLRPTHGGSLALANRMVDGHGVEAQPSFLCLLDPHSTHARPVGTLSAPGAAWALAAIHAPEAWQISEGEPSVIVAVLDSGVDRHHPDLELVTGFDTVPGGHAEPGPQPLAREAHGTACSGIAGGQGRNTLGVRGVAPRSRIAPVRLGRMTQFGYDCTEIQIAECLRHASSFARILSNSYVAFPHMVIQRAIEDAVRQGCVVVAAAGNDGGSVNHPAAYPDVIAVAAHNEHDRPCGPDDWAAGKASCKGKEISVAAPGVHVWTTDLTGDQGYSPDRDPQGFDPNYTSTFGGTSAACPFVAGTVALMLSVNPALRPNEVREILEVTAEKVGDLEYPGGRNDRLGHGRVNAFAAVELAARRRV